MGYGLRMPHAVCGQAQHQASPAWFELIFPTSSHVAVIVPLADEETEAPMVCHPLSLAGSCAPAWETAAAGPGMAVHVGFARTASLHTVEPMKLGRCVCVKLCADAAAKFPSSAEEIQTKGPGGRAEHWAGHLGRRRRGLGAGRRRGDRLGVACSVDLSQACVVEAAGALQSD